MPVPTETDMTARVLLTAAQTGRRLGLTADTIKRWARLGRIPAIRVTGKTVRFNWDRVVAALEAQSPDLASAAHEVK